MGWRRRARRYRNRRIGEMLKELELTEGRGTGISKIVRAMRENGSPAPIFEFDEDHSYFLVTLPIHPKALIEGPVEVTDQVTDPLARFLRTLGDQELSAAELLHMLGLAHMPSFRAIYLWPALEAGLIEMTIPSRPQSSKQRYRLTAVGRRLVKG